RPRGPGVPHEASCVFTARGGGRGGDGRPPGRRHGHRSHGRRDLRLGFVCPAGHPDRAGALTGLTAAPGNGTATLSWSPPGSDGGSPVDFYVIEGGTSPSDDGILDKTGGHTA